MGDAEDWDFATEPVRPNPGIPEKRDTPSAQRPAPPQPPGTRVAFRMPNEMYEQWADSAIDSLKGAECDFSLLGEPIGRALIIDATRYTDSVLGDGIWIEVVLR